MRQTFNFNLKKKFQYNSQTKESSIFLCKPARARVLRSHLVGASYNRFSLAIKYQYFLLFIFMIIQYNAHNVLVKCVKKNWTNFLLRFYVNQIVRKDAS